MEGLSYDGIQFGWGWGQNTFAGGTTVANNSIDGVLSYVDCRAPISYQDHHMLSAINSRPLHPYQHNHMFPTIVVLRYSADGGNIYSQSPQVSTRILGRRTAPFPPFLISNRVPHGLSQDSSTDRGHLRRCSTTPAYRATMPPTTATATV